MSAQPRESAHVGPDLSGPDILALPSGTEVVVTWSGGNGPHRYTVTHVHGEACVNNIYRDPLVPGHTAPNTPHRVTLAIV